MPRRKRTGRVDVHLHLSRWWNDLPRTAYRPDLEYTIRGLLAEMDRHKISEGLLLQLFEAPSTREAVEEGRSEANESGGRLHPVATVDPCRGPESLARSLELLADEPGLVALKLYPGYRPFYPHDRRLDPVYEFARARSLPVLLHQGDTLDGLGLVKYARPIEVDEVAGRFRDVRFVLCHLGNPWIEETAELVYKNPNVWTDTSGLLAHPSTPYFERMVTLARERLFHAILSVGAPDRFLYGSDWPLVELGVSIDLVDRLDLPDTDREKILGGNARRLFRLSPE